METQGALEDGGQSLARGGVTVELSSSTIKKHDATIVIEAKNASSGSNDDDGNSTSSKALWILFEFGAIRC